MISESTAKRKRTDWPSDNDEEYAARKLHILETIADRRLRLIIDNYDVQGDPDFDRFCEGPYSLIFTTRYHQERTGIRELEILPMTDEEELMELFRAEYKRALTPEDEESVRRIIAFMEGHTLSIRLIASAMQARTAHRSSSRGCTPGEWSSPRATSPRSPGGRPCR